MSASGETKIVFELSGTGTPVSEMETTSTTTTPGSSDTGIFTNTDGSLKSSAVIGGAICALAVIAIVFARYMKSPHAKHAILTRDFGIHDKEGISKKFGIFGGFFVLAILASGAILPNLLPEAESASAADLAVTLGSEETGGALTTSGKISQTGSTFIKITEDVTCSVACTIKINTPSVNSNSLNLDGKTDQGYIKPTSGTSSAKTALGENQWGYTTGTSTPTAAGKVWATVPTTATQVGTTTESNKTLKVTYGANVSGKIPTGSYSNTIVYTAISE